ncbi:hypothetical protein SKAU_G00303380 [Synaphobranchus kaupii]|uniref:Uncharacterized protein n=1 Tax=Synaphobranchus kaupii TaxID=118154 RepID=A0A9Q1EW63_SYNKA|nr:hypothetical protein SKAU_G00303380 [Synaphobranchus kaupii]
MSVLAFSKGAPVDGSWRVKSAQSEEERARSAAADAVQHAHRPVSLMEVWEWVPTFAMDFSFVLLLGGDTDIKANLSAAVCARGSSLPALLRWGMEGSSTRLANWD